MIVNRKCPYDGFAHLQCHISPVIPHTKP